MILLFSLHSSFKPYLSNYKHEFLVLKIAQPAPTAKSSQPVVQGLVLKRVNVCNCNDVPHRLSYLITSV